MFTGIIQSVGRLLRTEIGFTIKNDGDFKKLYKQIDSILQQIKVKLAAVKP